MTQPKLFTPLTIGIMCAVIGLSAALLILQPEQSLRWSAALLFFPVIVITVHWLSQRDTRPRITARMMRGIRTGIVGGGVLIATALATAIGEVTGILGAEGAESGNSFLLILPAIIAVAIDMLTVRLEKKAVKD